MNRRIAAWLCMTCTSACTLDHGREDPTDMQNDAGVAADATAPQFVDASTEDAPAYLQCSPSSESGFRIDALAPITLPDPGELPYAYFVIAGDEDVAYIALGVQPADTTRTELFELTSRDVALGQARRAGSVDGTMPGLFVESGVAHLTTNNGSLVLSEARSGRMHEVGTTQVAHLSRMINLKPTWNGTDTILALGAAGAFVGPFRDAAESTSWIEGGEMPSAFGHAENGTTDVIYQDYVEGYPHAFYRRIDRQGVATAPLDFGEMPQSRLVEDFYSRPNAHWRWFPDDSDAPLLFVTAPQSSAAAPPVIARRYRLDGTMRDEHAHPLTPSLVDLDVAVHVPNTTVTGYGMIARTTEDGSFFRGVAGAHQSDWEQLPFTEDCVDVIISEAPCGYLAACRTQTQIQLAHVAVPLRPAPGSP